MSLWSPTTRMRLIRQHYACRLQSIMGRVRGQRIDPHQPMEADLSG